MEGKNIKLYYFDLHARGEIIRSILYYNKVQYEDIRISFAEWGEKKNTFLNGQVPILEIDGKQLSQSTSIARYLAQLHGQYPTDPREIYQVESTLDFFADAALKLAPWFKEQDPVKKQAIQDEFLKNTIPVVYTTLNNILKQNTTGSGYFVGKSLTLLDFAVVNFATRPLLAKLDQAVIDANPELTAYIKEKTEGEFKEYLSTRKPAPF